jgi:DHA3 family macrolide efflux protein-like MFS transporter
LVSETIELSAKKNQVEKAAEMGEDRQAVLSSVTQRRFLSGIRGFTVVWVGQLVSLLGTGMTRFALTIWAWQVTGEATALALVGFFSFAPTVIMSPFAGAIVDRSNRKMVMMLSDLAAGLATVAVLLLQVSGRLKI